MNELSSEVKELTPSRRIKKPLYATVASWVKRAWDNINIDLIKKSFKCCSEDNLIFDYDILKNKTKKARQTIYIDEEEESQSEEVNDDNIKFDDINEFTE
ncbi:3648_t:CDS:2 [Funneliformis mosseae]|uniref:3648_t:CDS:1 n=1 Tax=Funneliformis mosseae TaxID=27381 RepID=A0A9N8W046_FUNMO|nr:3648_t:CDS:2 [Funneliformis mosseae]